MKTKVINTPIGQLAITEDDGAIIKIVKSDVISNESSKLLDMACQQIAEYFDHKRRIFTFPIKIGRYNEIYEQLRMVPYGTTISYKELAIRCTMPKAARFIGNVMHQNELLLVVPCHRVIKADGSLGGFGLGLDIKRYLLELEMAPQNFLK